MDLEKAVEYGVAFGFSANEEVIKRHGRQGSFHSRADYKGKFRLPLWIDDESYVQYVFRDFIAKIISKNSKKKLMPVIALVQNPSFITNSEEFSKVFFAKERAENDLNIDDFEIGYSVKGKKIEFKDKEIREIRALNTKSNEAMHKLLYAYANSGRFGENVKLNDRIFTYKGKFKKNYKEIDDLIAYFIFPNLEIRQKQSHMDIFLETIKEYLDEDVTKLATPEQVMELMDYFVTKQDEENTRKKAIRKRLKQALNLEFFKNTTSTTKQTMDFLIKKSLDYLTENKEIPIQQANLFLTKALKVNLTADSALLNDLFAVEGKIYDVKQKDLSLTDEMIASIIDRVELSLGLIKKEIGDFIK